MPRPITLDLLRQHDTCPEALARFAELFPTGAVVPTVELAERHAHEFSNGMVQVIGHRLLTKEGRAAFGRALEAAVRRHDFYSGRGIPLGSPRWQPIEREFARCCLVAFVQIWNAGL